jgi:hypothetical protein
VEGYQAILAELAASNDQHPARKIHVLYFKVECLAYAKASNAEKSEKRIVDPWQQHASSWIRTIWR